MISHLPFRIINAYVIPFLVNLRLGGCFEWVNFKLEQMYENINKPVYDQMMDEDSDYDVYEFIET